MLIVALLCLTLSVFSSGADGAEPVGTAEDVLQLAFDSLVTREAQWTEGTMDVRIEETGTSPMSADFTLTWSDRGVYIDLRQYKSTSLSLEGKIHEEEHRPHRSIFTLNEEWSYVPSLTAAFGVGPGRMRKFRGELNVRPLTAWGTYPGAPQVKLSRLIRPSSAKQAEVSEVEEGLARVDTKKGLVLFVDVAGGGDLVRLEHNMHKPLQVEPGIDPGIKRATYEWARDADGVPYCRMFRAEFFRPDGTGRPVVVREVEVTSYNSQLSKEEARFNLARLEIPKGTRMRYSAPGKNRAWRYGIKDSESELLQQPDFDRLINETKQSGFAAPKDE